ncbi:homoserine kinase [Nakamurella endophytica]|uniref:homoserine kinase n=1 Tax=Nakamurella endophytica TaxID=1748367 RepID=UPI00357109E3
MRVPATSANLGPGYDSFGLALDRWDEVRGSLQDGVQVTVEGVGTGQLPLDGRHLVVRAVAAAWTAAGRQLPGLRLHGVNRIPHGGGQGSSAAAIVSGLLLGRALLPDPSVLSDQRLLELGTAMEGHPDNVAPALSGGLTLAFTARDGRPRAVHGAVHPAVRAVLFTASTGSSTHHTRSLLPAVVPHADAAANAATAALLWHALTAEPALLFEATVDRLHQAYRAPEMPASAALLLTLRDAGVPAVLSGAGPSVLVLTDRPVPSELLRHNGFTVDPVPISALGGVVTAG